MKLKYRILNSISGWWYSDYYGHIDKLVVFAILFALMLAFLAGRWLR